MIGPMMVTSNGIPGYRIDAVYGQVFASTVRPGAGTGLLRSMGGSDEAGQLRIAHDTREHVLAELNDAALRAGGNAVVGLRFDSAAVGNGVELCAYGTAVRITPLGEDDPGATPQSIAEQQGQSGPATPQQSWPTMGGMGSLPYEEGQRPAAQPPQSTPTPSAAEPGPQPRPAGTEDATAERQRSDREGSWLDL